MCVEFANPPAHLLTCSHFLPLPAHMPATAFPFLPAADKGEGLSAQASCEDGRQGEPLSAGAAGSAAARRCSGAMAATAEVPQFKDLTVRKPSAFAKPTATAIWASATATWASATATGLLRVGSTSLLNIPLAC